MLANVASNLCPSDDFSHDKFSVELIYKPSILLTGEKIPRNKGGHFPFRKSQLDSRMFGTAGPMGLWTRYHLGGDLKSIKLNQEKEYQLGLSYSNFPRKKFKSNLKLTYPAGASLSLTTSISHLLRS